VGELFLEPHDEHLPFAACSESDDGVSVISDICLEEEEEVQAPLEESACEEQELLQLGEKGEPQYKHRPNPELNFVLNTILVLAVASVSGLAIGHFLGAFNYLHELVAS
jgi:hypothetical protein